MHFAAIYHWLVFLIEIPAITLCTCTAKLLELELSECLQYDPDYHEILIILGIVVYEDTSFRSVDLVVTREAAFGNVNISWRAIPDLESIVDG